MLSNQQRVTLACFLAYFIMSGMLSPIGVVIPPLAVTLGVDHSAAARLFGWLTMGILLGSAAAVYVVSRFSFKWLFLVLSLVLAAAMMLLRLSEVPAVIQLSLGLIGVSCGVALAAAASVIAASYTEAKRASMLVITDASFSTAGIFVSLLAVYAVAQRWHWSSTYLALGGIALLLFALSLSSVFPSHKRIDQEIIRDTSQTLMASIRRWPSPVWLCVLALFLYTLGQYSLLWWLPLHLQTELLVPEEAAGTVVARFWSGMFVAQLFVAWLVLRVGVQWMMLAGALGALLGTLPLILSSNVELILWLAVLWGFANLGLLKMVIAFATTLASEPAPSLVATLLFGATSGTAVSPFLTSAVVDAFGYSAVLKFGALCYGSLLLLLLLSAFAHGLENKRAAG
ncbi:MAG: MFS transporter [Pseudomonadota bacterium]